MSASSKALAGDQVRVSVSVRLPPQRTFALFTDEIDRWWRRGPRFRQAGARGGFVHIEPRVGGRMFEQVDAEGGPQVLEVGRVEVWEPPQRLVFTWRASNFAPGEATEVEVLFRPSGAGTMVTVTHRGWAALRADHPVRHGLGIEAFCRMMGLWWGDQMSAMRECGAGQVPGA